MLVVHFGNWPAGRDSFLEIFAFDRPVYATYAVNAHVRHGHPQTLHCLHTPARIWYTSVRRFLQYAHHALCCEAVVVDPCYLLHCSAVHFITEMSIKVL